MQTACSQVHWKLPAGPKLISGFHLTVEEQLLQCGCTMLVVCACASECGRALAAASFVSHHPRQHFCQPGCIQVSFAQMQTCQKYKYAGSDTTVSQRRVRLLSAEAANHRVRYTLRSLLDKPYTVFNCTPLLLQHVMNSQRWIQLQQSINLLASLRTVQAKVRHLAVQHQAGWCWSVTLIEVLFVVQQVTSKRVDFLLHFVKSRGKKKKS